MLRHWHDEELARLRAVYGHAWITTHLSHAHDDNTVAEASVEMMFIHHASLHENELWREYMSSPVGFVEITVDGDSSLASDIQRAMGKVDIEHFHLREDCVDCNVLAELPATENNALLIRGHILTMHAAEVSV